MPEGPDHQLPTDVDEGGHRLQGEGPDKRLALLASYVQADGRLRLPGLVIVDPNGVERIVVEADDR